MFFYNEESTEVSGGVPLPTSWSELTKLTASDNERFDNFGYSVSISRDGSTLAVGALSEDPNGISNAGSVYVFQNTNATWTEVQKLTASDKEANDWFGYSVSISEDGSTLAVGASSEDPNGISNAGSVYVFQNTNGTWTEIQKLTASDKERFDNFGFSVSISSDGSTIAVGAYEEDPDGISGAGSVYVFQNTNGTWAEVQKLTASDKEASDQFGSRVSISEDGSTLAVGAFKEDPNGISGAGSVYVFQNTNGTWTEVQKLTASDKEAVDEFGSSVSISEDGSTLAVGASEEGPNGISYAGSVYVFQNTNGTWTEIQKLTASDKETSDKFGYSVSISEDGSTLAVGAFKEDPNGISNAGSVYVFQNTNGTWTEIQKLTASDKEANDRFGSLVSISEDGSTLAVGAHYEDPNGISDAGSVYVFQGT